MLLLYMSKYSSFIIVCLSLRFPGCVLFGFLNLTPLQLTRLSQPKLLRRWSF